MICTLCTTNVKGKTSNHDHNKKTELLCGVFAYTKGQTEEYYLI